MLYLSLTLAVAILVCVILITAIEARLQPMASAAAEAQAQNAVSSILEQAFTAELSQGNWSYSDLITMEYDGSGHIMALTTNMGRMNHLRSHLVDVALNSMAKISVADIQIPLGNVLHFDFLWAHGPNLKIRSMTVGTIHAEFDSEFASAGVNQTVHRIWLDVVVPLTVLLPGGSVSVPVHTRHCMAETIIVGRVPDTVLQIPDNR